MSAQRAYDLNNPNGSSRRTQGDRVAAIFRMYRRAGAPPLPPIDGAGPLGTVRQGIRTARELLRDNVLAPLGGGFILEREYRFVLIYEGLDFSQEVRANVSYVRDGYFIDMPMKNALGFAHFSMSGRTHWEPVMVNGVPVDGDAGLKDFIELVKDYFYPGNLLGGAPGDYQLRWYNLVAPISASDPFGEFEWVIQPKSIPSYRKSAQRPFQSSFRFDFYGLSSNQDAEKSEDGFLAGLWSRGLLRGLLELAHLGALADALDAVFGTIAEFQGLLDDVNNVVTAALDYVNGVREFIQYSFAKVRGLISTLDEIKGRIEQGIELAADIGSLTDEQLDLLRQEFPGMDAGAIDAGTGQRISTQESTKLGLLSVAQVVQLQDALLLLASQPRSFSPLLATQAPQRTIAIDIPAGVTIDTLAARANVTVDELVAVNNLQYPFIDQRERPAAKLARLQAEHDDLRARDNRRTTQGQATLYDAQLATLSSSIVTAQSEATANPAQPGVLYAFDSIRVPQRGGNLVPSIIGSEGNQILASGETVNEEERLFGIDLLLTRDGLLVWDETANDIMLARGLNNMQLVQERYVALPLGAVAWAPAIGNYAFADLSQWQGPGTNYLLAYALYRTLIQDPRVKLIRNMRAVTEGGVATLVYSALLINGQDLPELRAPIEVVSNV